mmetsp:Transcript_2199/g.6393  ORF Transcript_2199/g.6393 Transcript_2199/m.6393 type:complete len:318 (-) Transcript_2199:874-1827(-)
MRTPLCPPETDFDSLTGSSQTGAAAASAPLSSQPRQREETLCRVASRPAGGGAEGRTRARTASWPPAPGTSAISTPRCCIVASSSRVCAAGSTGTPDAVEMERTSVRSSSDALRTSLSAVASSHPSSDASTNHSLGAIPPITSTAPARLTPAAPSLGAGSRGALSRLQQARAEGTSHTPLDKPLPLSPSGTPSRARASSHCAARPSATYLPCSAASRRSDACSRADCDAYRDHKPLAAPSSPRHRWIDLTIDGVCAPQQTSAIITSTPGGSWKGSASWSRAGARPALPMAPSSSAGGGAAPSASPSSGWIVAGEKRQ